METIGAKIAALRRERGPVSYTHLDVYKRQALAVGAADVDKFQSLFRVPQMLQKGPDPIQTGLLAPPLDAVYVC